MDLKNNFFTTAALLGAKSHPKAAYKDLLRRYIEPHRHYHTLDHIADCLEELESVKHLLEKPLEATCALWFHDAVYDVNEKDYPDNEAASSNLLYDFLKQEGVVGDQLSRMCDLVMCTNHAIVPRTHDQRFVADIDLSILGKSPEKYDAYARGIEKEFKQIPKHDFNFLRTGFLRSMLSTDLFHTEEFRDRYAEQARKNIKREIELRSQ